MLVPARAPTFLDHVVLVPVSGDSVRALLCSVCAVNASTSDCKYCRESDRILRGIRCVALTLALTLSSRHIVGHLLWNVESTHTRIMRHNCTGRTFDWSNKLSVILIHLGIQ